MSSENITFILALVLAFIALVSSITFYNLKKDEAIQLGISTAMEKGIDPVAVRCAFSSPEDKMCLVYVAANKKQ
jgi:hypothetical protein